MRVLAGAAAAALAVAGCGHTDPANADIDRPGEPFGGPGGRLITQAGMPIWSEDGNSILIIRQRFQEAGPLDRSTFRVDSLDNCILRVPGTGGSATWQYCVSRVGERDSNNIIPAAALSAQGKLLFVEFKGRTGRDYPPPLGYEADLWVADTGRMAEPVHLMTLYRDRFPGQTLVPRDSVNYLTDLRWISGNRFIASGWNIHPGDTFFLPLAWVLGTISDGSVTIARVPGPNRTMFGTDRGALLTLGTANGIDRIDPSTGEILATTSFPEGVQVLSADCSPARCLAITTAEAKSEVQVWRFDRQSGDAIHLGRMNALAEQGVVVNAAAGRIISSNLLLGIPFPLQ